MKECDRSKQCRSSTTLKWLCALSPAEHQTSCRQLHSVEVIRVGIELHVAPRVPAKPEQRPISIRPGLRVSPEAPERNKEEQRARCWPASHPTGTTKEHSYMLLFAASPSERAEGHKALWLSWDSRKGEGKESNSKQNPPNHFFRLSPPHKQSGALSLDMQRKYT